jgi:hypothetical protein
VGLVAMVVVKALSILIFFGKFDLPVPRGVSASWRSNSNVRKEKYLAAKTRIALAKIKLHDGV